MRVTSYNGTQRTFDRWWRKQPNPSGRAKNLAWCVSRNLRMEIHLSPCAVARGIVLEQMAVLQHELITGPGETL